MEPDPLARRVHVAAEVIEDGHALAEKKAGESAGVPEGPQVPADDQPVDSRERSYDLLPMDILECAPHRPSQS